jgi:hypothetical protein
MLKKVDIDYLIESNNLKSFPNPNGSHLNFETKIFENLF